MSDDGRGGRGRPRRDGVDRISGLPDDLLHSILLRLPSTADAVRTSALSRIWRRVWAHVPAISFDTDRGRASRRASMLRGLGAVLAAHAAPTLDRLAVSFSEQQDGGDPALVAAWLRFAAPRVAGELSVRSGEPPAHPSPESVREIDVPVCERATAIDLRLSLRLGFPATGLFAALRVLSLDCLHLYHGDLERAVSSQCPRLQELTLSTSLRITLCVCHACRSHTVSIRSDSLERLKLRGEVANGRVTVDAPRLVRLEMSRSSSRGGAHIAAAPELAEVIWHNAYSSQSDRIAETRRQGGGAGPPGSVERSGAGGNVTVAAAV